MPEQISQQDQLAWAKLCNHKQVMVALWKVTAEQKAVHTIEKQHSNNAHHSHAHCPQLKVPKKLTMKWVCLHLLILLFLMSMTLLQRPQLVFCLLPSRNPMQIPLKSIKDVDAISDSGFSI